MFYVLCQYPCAWPVFWRHNGDTMAGSRTGDTIAPCRVALSGAVRVPCGVRWVPMRPGHVGGCFFWNLPDFVSTSHCQLIIHVYMCIRVYVCVWVDYSRSVQTTIDRVVHGTDVQVNGNTGKGCSGQGARRLCSPLGKGDSPGIPLPHQCKKLKPGVFDKGSLRYVGCQIQRFTIRYQEGILQTGQEISSRY